ncbi:MAG TPA: trypsin-like peptidase domain-containing protein [Tepidisphaeraceae bacterium]|nr:trypsin-like peptidase domain-containing protein [Tepidisphaeraceae bacterium]
MSRRLISLPAVVALALCLSVVLARADTIVLIDGTELEVTTIIAKPDGYWVKLASGESRTLLKSQVKEVRKGSPSAGAKPTVNAPAAKPSSAGSSSAKPASGGDAFKYIKSRADRVDDPITAVAMWEKFVESNPASPDIDAAKAELEKWQTLQKDEAEKINGKWVSGDEKKQLFEKVEKLTKDGTNMLEGTQQIEGIKKLEEVLKLYPNSFEANFALGYHYLSKGLMGSDGRGNLAYMDKSIVLLENAAKIQPKSAACWSNLAIGYNFRKRYELSLQVAYKAAKIRDDKDVVQNLVNAIAQAPRGMQTSNQKLKPIIEDALQLARKHGIDPGSRVAWQYIRPIAADEAQIVSAGGDSDIDEGKAGPAWSGSGFFITPDGYFLTNHHVATGDAKSPIKKNITFRVRMDDGSEKNAELIAVDDDADVALMKIKTDSPVPFLKLADDNPKQASRLLVLGYPTTGTSKSNLQVSEGSVKSINDGDEHEVWMDLNTTHGNSGGPIVDRNSRVVAILTAGRQVHNMTIVLGVGPKQIKRFFDKIGGKAPKTAYWEPAGTGEFDGERLTDTARKATLLVIAIRVDKADIANAVASAGESTEAAPATQPGD